MSTVVITGIGGMGLAIARRLGSGKRLLLADYSEDALKKAATTFGDAGFNVETKQVDVADADSVRSLAEHAKGLGNVEIVVHTAGELSPKLHISFAQNCSPLTKLRHIPHWSSSFSDLRCESSRHHSCRGRLQRHHRSWRFHGLHGQHSGPR